RSQESSASEIGNARENALMQSGADLFVAAARSATSQGFTLENLLVWLADRHTMSIAATEAFSKAGWYGRAPVRIPNPIYKPTPWPRTCAVSRSHRPLFCRCAA